MDVPVGRAPGPVQILGVPVDIGAGHRGAAMGPAALRTVGLAEALRDLGRDVTDLGDLMPDTDALRAAGGDRLKAVTAWCRPLAECSYGIMREGAVPVFLGG